MNGKYVAGFLIGIAVVMGAGLWYAQYYGWYTNVTGRTHIVADGQLREIRNYRGIDGDSSPLKLRGCFQADWSLDTDLADLAPEAEPLVAPGWFDCFDAKMLAADIKSGRARVITSEINQPYGFTAYIALYPDGRGFVWRQINACGTAAFAGDDVPPGCEKAQIGTTEPELSKGPKVPRGDTVQVPAPTPPAVVQDISAATVAPQGLAPAALPDQGAVASAPADRADPAPVRQSIADLDLLLVATGQAEPLQSGDLDSANGTACLRTRLSFGLLSETFQLADPVDVPASQQTCFDADQIAVDIDTGTALLLPARANGNRPAYIAVYADGQGFAWLADD